VDLDLFGTSAAFMVVSALATWLRWRGPGIAARRVRRFARRVDLGMDGAVEATVTGHLARRERAGAVGGLVVGPAAAAVVATAPTRGDYVARHERVGSWVTAGIAAAAGVGFLLADRAGALDGAVPVGVAVAAIVVPPVAVVADEVLVLLLGGVAMLVTSLVIGPERHLRRRLWPDLPTSPPGLELYADSARGAGR